MTECQLRDHICTVTHHLPSNDVTHKKILIDLFLNFLNFC